jgi:hypothetical protein
MSLYGINLIFFLSNSDNPSDKLSGFKFFVALKSNLSLEPCQLPAQATIRFFLDIALQILSDLNTASLPELVKINLE